VDEGRGEGGRIWRLMWIGEEVGGEGGGYGVGGHGERPVVMVSHQVAGNEMVGGGAWLAGCTWTQ